MKIHSAKLEVDLGRAREMVQQLMKAMKISDEQQILPTYEGLGRD